MMQLTEISFIPLFGIIIVLAGYILLISYKNYRSISGEHMGIILMAWCVAKAMQISATLIVVYWRAVIFESALVIAGDYGATGTLMAMGDIFVAIVLVYVLIFIPETFLKIIVSRHRLRDRQSSYGRGIMSSMYV